MNGRAFTRQDTQCIDRIYHHGVPYYRIAKEGFSFRGIHLRVRCSFYQGGLEAEFFKTSLQERDSFSSYALSSVSIFVRHACKFVPQISSAHFRRVPVHHRHTMVCRIKELFFIRI